VVVVLLMCGTELVPGLIRAYGLLLDQGDYAAARPLCERALAIYERALGADHPATTPSLDNLARLFQIQGDYTIARQLYESALTRGSAGIRSKIGNKRKQVQIWLILVCYVRWWGAAPSGGYQACRRRRH